MATPLVILEKMKESIFKANNSRKHFFLKAVSRGLL